MTADNIVDRKEVGERLKRHIIVGLVGPVGAGKSTLAVELGKKWGVAPIEENFGTNPYLEDFYTSPGEYSFKCQEWFLEQKALQLASIDTSRISIIDPSIEMDFLYAETHRRLGWMTEAEWNRYRMAFISLRSKYGIEPPDISIVVNANDTKVLLERIKTRGRKYELIMLESHPEYFLKLKETVDEWTLKKYPEKIVFDASYYNFLPGGKDLNEVLGRIEGITATYLSKNRNHPTVDFMFPPFEPGPQLYDRAIKV